MKKNRNAVKKIDKNMVEHKGPRVYDYKNLGA